MSIKDVNAQISTGIVCCKDLEKVHKSYEINTSFCNRKVEKIIACLTSDRFGKCKFHTFFLFRICVSSLFELLEIMWMHA